MATSSRKSSLRAAVAIVGAVVMTLLFVAVPAAEAAHVEPELKQGNPTCEDFEPEGESWTQFKVDGDSDGGATDEVASGTYSDGTLTVEITVRDTEDGPVLDWDANLAVDAVVVKGGPNANLYEYDPEVSADDGLHSPFNANSGKYYGLSHVSFCYDVEQPPAGPAGIDLTVDKVNDADGDGLFSEGEIAPVEGATVDFRVTVAVPEGSGVAVDLSSATDVYPTGDGDTSNDSSEDLFELCDELSDGTVIAPGESVTCTFTLTDYAPVAGATIQDTVVVEGHEQGDADNTVFDQDDSTVTTPSRPPAGPAGIDLTVDKVNDADGDGLFSEGEIAPVEGATVDFRVTVAVPEGSGVAVDLSSATDVYPTGDGDTSNDSSEDLFELCDELSDGTVIAPGESVTCTFTLTDYAPVAGATIQDTVVVEGHEQGDADNTVFDQDDSTVETEQDEVAGEQEQRDDTTTPAGQPAIAVTKTALVDPAEGGRMVVTFVPGDGDEETVTYRYVVTNTGDTTLEQVQLTDDVLGTVTLDDTTLAPGASTTATATHVLTAADAGDGEIVNVATAVGTSPEGQQVRATDDARVLVAEVRPAVEAAGDVRSAVEADDRLPGAGADPLEGVVLAIMVMALGGATLLWTRMGAARG